MAGRALSSLNLSQIKFFGRQRELDVLENTLDRVTEEGSTAELVAIGGYSGTGKSRLVETFQTRFIQKQAIYCSGKCDPSRIREPFSVMQDVFKALSRTLLNAEDETSRVVIENVRRVVGDQSSILVNVMPCLSELIAPPTCSKSSVVAPIASSTDKARDQLQFLFRVFVRTVTATIPLVIFCDDLQWSDGSSLQLLSALVTDPRMSRLLVVTSYRDNEIDRDHLVSETIKVIERKKMQPCVHLELEAFTAEELTTLISRILRMSPDETIELSSVVYQKTHGNVFFSLQFLQDLEHRGLLRYSEKKFRWCWADPQKIQADTTIADNVVDMITNKIRSLSQEEQNCLKVASCLSSVIGLKLLQTLLPAMGITMNRGLEAVLEGIEKKGFLQRVENLVGEVEYEFVHDRIQQAAYQLIPEGQERDRTHYDIGTVLVRMIRESSGTQEGHLVMFLAADQLQKGHNCITESELVDLAAVNLRTGKTAMSVGALVPAAQYLSNGITILNGIRNSWDIHHDLQIGLHQNLAEVLWCIGSPAKSVSLARKVETRARTRRERLAATSTLAQALGAQEKHGEALEVELRELRALKIIPRAFHKARTLLLLFRLRSKMRNVTKEQVLNLPMCTDDRIISALVILYNLIKHATFAGDEILQLMAILMSIKLTLKHGIHEVSVGAFAQMGAILSLLFGDANEASRLGMMTMGLLERLGKTNAAASLVIYGYIYPWSSPLTDTLQPLLNAYESGLKQGDIEFALICFTTYILNGFMSGLTLSSLLEDARIHSETAEEYGIHSIMPVIRVLRQMLSNLVGNAANPLVLTGEAMDEDSFQEAGYSNIALYNFYIYKMQVCYYYGDILTAHTFLKKAIRKKSAAGAFSERSTLMSFKAFVHLALASKTNWTGAKKHKRRAASAIRSFRRDISRDSKGINLSHKLMLLDAGFLALDNTFDETTVRQAFDRAITLASRAGFRQDAALGNQLAGEYLLYGAADYNWAPHYLARSIQLYRDWGARGLADEMESKYEQEVDLVTIANLESTNHHGISRHPGRRTSIHLLSDCRDLSLSGVFIHGSVISSLAASTSLSYSHRGSALVSSQSGRSLSNRASFRMFANRASMGYSQRTSFALSHRTLDEAATT